MAKYEYVALDAKGKETKGAVEATNQTAAIGSIREKGLFPTSINEAGSIATPAAQVKGRAKPKSSAMKMNINFNIGFSRVKPKMIMATTRQLATLIQAGMPLVRSLRVLEKQEKHPALKNAVGDIADSIEAGSTFAEALSQHPKVFNKLFVNMVKAGEIGGILDTVLERLAEFMEKGQKIRNKVKSAMIYPVVVLVMALGILAFLMIFIIPRFEEIFEDMMDGQQLPALTRIVLAISRGFVSYWYLVAGGVVVGTVLFRLAGKTKKGRYAIDWFKLHSPVFGPLMSKTAIARFARTLGTLMNSGVPVLQSLNIVRDTAGNEVVARAVHTVHDAVKEGENMAPPIEASGIFPPVVVSMIEVGEETGAVPDMLVRVADNYEDEVDNAVAGITSIIEPILIVFLAFIVGTIVIALFLPLISIITNLSG